MKSSSNWLRGGRVAALGGLWTLGSCAVLIFEISPPLPDYPAPRLNAVADTLRGHVLALPPVVVRAPMRGQANGFSFTAGKRVQQGELLVRLNTVFNDSAGAQLALVEAPTTGIAGPPLVAGNELVAAGTPLVALTDLSRLRLLLTSRGRFTRTLHPGDRVRLRGQVLGLAAVAGTVETVGPLVAGTAHAGQVVVQLQAPLMGPLAAQKQLVLVRLPTPASDR